MKPTNVARLGPTLVELKGRWWIAAWRYGHFGLLAGLVGFVLWLSQRSRGAPTEHHEPGVMPDRRGT